MKSKTKFSNLICTGKCFHTLHVLHFRLQMRMPRGVTPTRVRRRQSDAKWRASVAMCYNVMKHVIPHSKRYSKASKRKLSKVIYQMI